MKTTSLLALAVVCACVALAQNSLAADKKKPAPATAQQLEDLKGADLHEIMYRHLLDKDPVPDAALLALATQRGQTLLQAFRETHPAVAERISLGQPDKVDNSGATVLAKLALGVAP